MPFYEYRCNECNHLFTHLARRMSETAPDCPECGAAAPKKMFSTFNASVSHGSVPSCSLGKCPSAAGPDPGMSPCAQGRCPLG